MRAGSVSSRASEPVGRRPGVVAVGREQVGVVVATVGVGADPRAHHVGPSPGVDLLAQPGPGPGHPRLVVGRDHVRDHSGASGGHLGEGGDLQVAEHRHRHRARDRRGGHHQHVRDGVVRPAACAQRIALLDAEAVLLVDHDQAEVGELDPLAEQRVGADHDPRRARGGAEQRIAPLRSGLRPGEQHHPGGTLGRAEHALLRQRPEQVAQRAQVLGGEHLGRREQRRLTAGVHHLEHRSQRDHRLARSDLALEQSLHGVGRREIRGDLRADLALARGERERQLGVERVEQPAGGAGPGHPGSGGRLDPAPGQRRLEHERLLVAQPTPPTVPVVVGERLVHQVQRLEQGRQPGEVADLLRQRIGHVGGRQGVEHGAHRALDPPGGQRRRRRVDRDRTARLDQGRGFVVHIGADQLVVGVGELGSAAVQPDRPGEHAEPSGPEPLLVRTQRARALGEERQRQLACTVGDHRLQQRASAGAHRAHGGPSDLGHHRDVLAGSERREVCQRAGCRVAPGVVPQQVADGVQAERRERAGGSGAQERAERLRPPRATEPDHRTCLPVRTSPRPGTGSVWVLDPRSATLSRLSGHART